MAGGRAVSVDEVRLAFAETCWVVVFHGVLRSVDVAWVVWESNPQVGTVPVALKLPASYGGMVSKARTMPVDGSCRAVPPEVPYANRTKRMGSICFDVMPSVA